MRIKFIDYKGRPHYISMPDNTSKIVIKVVKEDMIETDPTCFDVLVSHPIKSKDNRKIYKQEQKFGILVSQRLLINYSI